MAQVESQASLGPKLAALFFAAGMQFVTPGGPRADCYKWSYRAPINGLLNGWGYDATYRGYNSYNSIYN